MISSINDSRKKIIFTKKILLEEKLKYQDETIDYKAKNLVIVVKTINQRSDFQGFLYDKDWSQIYMDSTFSPR